MNGNFTFVYARVRSKTKEIWRPATHHFTSKSRWFDFKTRDWLCRWNDRWGVRILRWQIKMITSSTTQRTARKPDLSHRNNNMFVELWKQRRTCQYTETALSYRAIQFMRASRSTLECSVDLATFSVRTTVLMSLTPTERARRQHRASEQYHNATLPAECKALHYYPLEWRTRWLRVLPFWPYSSAATSYLSTQSEVMSAAWWLTDSCPGKEMAGWLHWKSTWTGRVRIQRSIYLAFSADLMFVETAVIFKPCLYWTGRMPVGWYILIDLGSHPFCTETFSTGTWTRLDAILNKSHPSPVQYTSSLSWSALVLFSRQ